MHETDLAEFYLSPDVSWQPFDLNRCPSLDSILLSTCFNNRVHIIPFPSVKNGSFNMGMREVSRHTRSNKRVVDIDMGPSLED